MEARFVFEGVSPAVVDAVRVHWSRKAGRLERFLRRVPQDQRWLRVTVRQVDSRVAARAVLVLPTGTLVARGESADHRAALDALLDELTLEVRRHHEAVRRDDAYRRKRRRQEDVARVAALLEEYYEQRDRSGFFDVLRPVLENLADHARHEVEVARLAGRLDTNAFTASDLLDETVVRAWERFGSRPPDRPLDAWLTALLHEVLDERAGGEPETVPLEEELPLEDPRVQGAGFEDLPWWEALDPPTVEDVLPDPKSGTPEVEREEERRAVLERLKRLPARRRRAILLHALEGWDEAEVALLQGRSVEEVRADIEAARRALREPARQPA